MLIVGNGHVVTRDAKNQYFPDGAVAIDGTTICRVGQTAEIRRAYPDAAFIDAKGGVIMPAFINVHEHIYSAMARGMNIDGYAPKGFLDILDGLWWNIDRHLTNDLTYLSAMETYVECIKNGVTTVFDHHASFGEIKDSLFAIGQAAQELGVRSCLCYEVSDRDGQEKARQAVLENEAWIRHAQADTTDMLAGMMGMHAQFTISDETMALAAEHKPDGVGYHIHVAEGIEDLQDCLKKHGKRIIDRLYDWNILGPKTLLGHCIHVNSAEIEIIKSTDTMVVNNPESNMGNAVGISPVLQLYKKGILIGMGTDAYTNDMLESLKVALCSQRHNACLPNVAWCEVTDMLFKNNAKMAERSGFPTLGVLKPGAAADVIVMDYKPYTPFSDANIDGHMIFGMTGRQCQTTMINGKILMKDRVLTEIDEEAVNAHVLESAKRLWGKLNHCEY